jgi:hypothetical protein
MGISSGTPGGLGAGETLGQGWGDGGWGDGGWGDGGWGDGSGGKKGLSDSGDRSGFTAPWSKGVPHKGQIFAALGIIRCSKKAQLGLGQDLGDMAGQWQG